ncbi:MAG: hypothetical protein ACI9XK_000443 [Granulosicoccus sp.]|jgi:hypothetical protein
MKVKTDMDNTESLDLTSALVSAKESPTAHSTSDFTGSDPTQPIGAGSDAIRPATVKLVTGNQLLVDDGETAAWATVALAYPYDAKPGDELLIACNPKHWYVIGVLNQGDTLTIATHGDIEFKARGQIRFNSRDGMCLQAPSIHLKTKHLSVVAESAVQHFDTLRTTVRGILSVKSGQIRNLVKGRYRLKATRIDQRASDDVNIDGKKINLG